ncbi:MAG: hypothetical protein R3C39_11250 [Dehalococcoidia bacterium]
MRDRIRTATARLRERVGAGPRSDYPALRDEAEALLQRFMEGGLVLGAHWWSSLVVVIIPASPFDAERDAYLTVESGWSGFDRSGGEVARVEAARIHEPTSVGYLAAFLAEFGRSPIRSASLGASRPDLTIEFETGARLRFDGHDEKYESWNVEHPGVFVVATPGDNVSFFDGTSG